MRRVLVLAIVGCSGSHAATDSGPTPITCDQHGGMGSGTLTDLANIAHPFGPSVHVTWQPTVNGLTGSITVDDGTTKIVMYGIASTVGAYPPPRGEYTDTKWVHDFEAPWGSPMVTPAALDVIVDVAPSMDPCWGGRFAVTYTADHGTVTGSISGWWANP